MLTQRKHTIKGMVWHSQKSFALPPLGFWTAYVQILMRGGLFMRCRGGLVREFHEWVGIFQEWGLFLFSILKQSFPWS